MCRLLQPDNSLSNLEISYQRKTQRKYKAGISFTSVFYFMPKKFNHSVAEHMLRGIMQKRTGKKKNGLTLRRDSSSLAMFFIVNRQERDNKKKTTGS